MKKVVWIMNHYAGGMFFDKGGRHYWFAKYLKREGYEPVVFCSNARHGKGENYISFNGLYLEKRAEEIDVPFIFVKNRTYKDNGKQRILNMVDFYFNLQKAAKQYARNHGKPDVIYASSVHPLTLVAGIKLAKYFGVRCICEVRDLWPESIVVYSNRLTRNHPLIKLLYKGEKWIYKMADALIFTMEGAYDYIVEQGWETEIPRGKVHYINNGVDLEEFNYNKEHFIAEDDDLNNPDIFKVVYTGSIRKANNIGLLIDAAKHINDPKVKLLIWGNGDEKDTLVQRVKDEGIQNVVFKGRVEKKYIPAIVCRADVNLVHLDAKNNSLLKYGISNNKMFDYFAAGKPIIEDFHVKYNPLTQYYCGICCQCCELSEEVEKIHLLTQEDKQILAQNCAIAANDYSFSNLTKKLVNLIEAANCK